MHVHVKICRDANYMAVRSNVVSFLQLYQAYSTSGSCHAFLGTFSLNSFQHLLAAYIGISSLELYTAVAFAHTKKLAGLRLW